MSHPCYLGEFARGLAPTEATDATIGSLAKMKAMRKRLLAGESLFHADDNPECGPGIHPFGDTHDHRQAWKHGKPTGLEGDDEE